MTRTELIGHAATALLVCTPYLNGGAFWDLWSPPRLLGVGGAAEMAWRVTPSANPPYA